MRKGSGKWIEGLTRTAAVLSAQMNVPVSKQAIKNWQHRNPPFPSPVNNRYHLPDCIAWMKANGKVVGTEQMELLDRQQAAVAEKKITAAEREKWEFEKERGEYLKRDVAEQTITATLKKYHGFVRTELERNLPDERRLKLAALGATPEIVAAFYEFDLGLARACVDKVEAQCAKESK